AHLRQHVGIGREHFAKVGEMGLLMDRAAQVDDTVPDHGAISVLPAVGETDELHPRLPPFRRPCDLSAREAIFATLSSKRCSAPSAMPSDCLWRTVCSR